MLNIFYYICNLVTEHNHNNVNPAVVAKVNIYCKVRYLGKNK